MFVLKFLAMLSPFLLVSTNVWSCLDDRHELADAQTQMMTELSCNSSLSTCRDIFFGTQKTNRFTADPSVLTCSSDTDYSGPLPLATVTAMGVSKTSTIIAGNRRRYLNQLPDFFHHTELHKRRVVELAKAVMGEYPEEFKDIDPEKAIRILTEHDNAKIDPRYRAANGKPFYQSLFNYVGEKAPQQLIDDLNFHDNKIINNAFEVEGIAESEFDSKEVAQKKSKERIAFKKLEELVDHVDRGMNPVSLDEFGRAGYKESETAKRAKQREMALFLEKNYSKIIKGLEFKPLTLAQQRSIANKILAHEKYYRLKNMGTVLKEAGLRSASTMAKIYHHRRMSKALMASRFGGRLLLLGFAALDALALGLYSPKMGCAAMGAHDWILDQNGNCVAKPGYSEPFINYISQASLNIRSQYGEGSTTCDLLNQNLQINQEMIFDEVACTATGARFSLGEKAKLDVDFDGEGSISKITSRELKSLWGKYRYRMDMHVKNGEIVKTCPFQRSTRGGSSSLIRSKCESNEKKINKTVDVNFVQGLQFKIYQGIACCLGQKNFLNQKISCKI